VKKYYILFSLYISYYSDKKLKPLYTVYCVLNGRGPVLYAPDLISVHARGHFPDAKIILCQSYLLYLTLILRLPYERTTKL
jgi:hypothetical protein